MVAKIIMVFYGEEYEYGTYHLTPTKNRKG